MHFLRWIVGVLWIAFFIWALIDIVSAGRGFGWKVLWIIICLVFPIVGVLAYYFFGHSDHSGSAPQA